MPFARLVAIFSPSFSLQIHARTTAQLQSQLAALKLDSRPKVLFFCSSAGEFEQAKPMIERLEAKTAAQCVVVFQSISGIRYANHRAETIPFFLAPFDFTSHWQRVFDHIRPQTSVVIRYEAWPAFIRIASQSSKLILVCASISEKFLTRLYFRSIAQSFSYVHCSNQKTYDYFTATLDANRVSLSGDTKFDRVLDRESRAISSKIKIGYSASNSRKFFLIGSGWKADVEMMLGAFSNNDELSTQWTAIVVPHDLSHANIDAIAEQIRERGLNPIVCAEPVSEVMAHSPKDVIVIVRLGILFEQYKSANAVMVGGGCHYKVHNVLEPAAFDLPICFGSSYTSQNEAIELVEKKLARVIHTSNDLSDWLMTLSSQSESKSHTRSWVETKKGASDKVVAKLVNDMNHRT